MPHEGHSKNPMPSCLLSRGNPAQYLPNIYGKPCTWWQELNLKLSFKISHLFNFFEGFNIVFACICNEKGFKVMKFWNICDRSVLHSNKSTRCCSKINFHACSLFSRLIHYHYQFFLLSHFALMHDLNLLKVYSV